MSGSPIPSQAPASLALSQEFRAALMLQSGMGIKPGVIREKRDVTAFRPPSGCNACDTAPDPGLTPRALPLCRYAALRNYCFVRIETESS